MMPIIKARNRGENTAHQLHAMTPVDFNITNIIVNNSRIPIRLFLLSTPHFSCVPHVSHVLQPPCSTTLPSRHIGQVLPISTPISAVSSILSSSVSLSSLPSDNTCESREPST